MNFCDTLFSLRASVREYNKEVFCEGKGSALKGELYLQVNPIPNLRSGLSRAPSFSSVKSPSR